MTHPTKFSEDPFLNPNVEPECLFELSIDVFYHSPVALRQ